MNMLYLNSNDGMIVSTYSKMSEAEKTPIEFLIEGNFSESLEMYQRFMKEDAKNPIIDENKLNILGYQFLGNKQIKIAQDILSLKQPRFQWHPVK